MSDIAKAYVQIIPSAEGIEGSITNLLSGEAQSAGSAGGEEVGNSLLSSLTTVIAGGAVAIGAAITATISAANATAEYGDAIDKTSQKMQISAEEYQTLAFAAEHCGFQTSVLIGAQKNLAKTDFSGNIYDAVNSVMELGTAEERNAKATELFGARAAQQMQALINGGQSADEFRQQLESLGGMMSDEAVKDSAAYEDALTDMKMAMDGLKRNAMAEFLPSMTDVMNGVAKLFSGDSEGFTMIQEGITQFGQKFLEGIPVMIENGKQLLDGLISGIKNNLPNLITQGFDSISNFVTGLINNAPELIQQGGEMVMSLLDGLYANIPAIIEGAGHLIMSIVQALIDNFPQILETGIEIVGKIGEGIINGATSAYETCIEVAGEIWNKFLETDWIQLGEDILSGIGSGIASAVSGLVGTAIEACASLTDSVKSFFGIASPSKLMRDKIGKYIPEGIAVGIEDNEGVVSDAINSINTDSAKLLNSSYNIGVDSDINGSRENGLGEVIYLLRQILDNGLTIDGESLAKNSNGYIETWSAREANAW